MTPREFDRQGAMRLIGELGVQRMHQNGDRVEDLVYRVEEYEEHLTLYGSRLTQALVKSYIRTSLYSTAFGLYKRVPGVRWEPIGYGGLGHQEAGMHVPWFLGTKEVMDKFPVSATRVAVDRLREWRRYWGVSKYIQLIAPNNKPARKWLRRLGFDSERWHPDVFTMDVSGDKEIKDVW